MGINFTEHIFFVIFCYDIINIHAHKFCKILERILVRFVEKRDFCFFVKKYTPCFLGILTYLIRIIRIIYLKYM